MTDPTAYMQRTRDYYVALGYGPPYRWAHFDVTPFAPLKRPLAETAVAIVTTAAPYQPGKGDQGPGAPYNAAVKFFDVYDGPTDTMPDLRISHIGIDRDHTTAEDIGSYFPLAALWRAAEAGRVQVAQRYYGLPTNRSQRVTMDEYCPDLMARCHRDGADAVVLVPNCPVCHQSVTLAARALEQAGIPSVVMGCAKDIVEYVGAPRFVFSDFPLGNSAGRPNDPDGQDLTLGLALDLLEQATTPNTTTVSPLEWPGDPAWKQDYSNPAKLSAEQIAARRAEFDAGKAKARELREA
ncbi:glycine reductase [Pseudoruegeria sp. HB172150]|uniref:glycine reductase n=1 Tax=Pseudoruegeria sp. HB172150 TaxID=2721164 RepID=UPI0020A639B6|nr:glycine reductase [Pseudoruegeria sp. HB172150]